MTTPRRQSSTSADPTGGVRLPPTPSQLQTLFDNSIWYSLSLWPALHVAIQNSWGGPDSADKKDWFAGAISDLFTSHPKTDFDDLVLFLLQVMQDEFDTNVEDDSEEDVAQMIMAVRKKLFEEGEVGVAKEVEERWRNRGRMKSEIRVVDGEVEGEWEDEEDEEEDDDDVEMGEAPRLVLTTPREKAEPEVDEEGFTKVVGKKRR